MVNNIDKAMLEIIKDISFRPVYVLFQLCLTEAGHLDTRNVHHVFVLVGIPGANS